MDVGAARCYPPDPAVLASARSFAAHRLQDLGLSEVEEDVQLLLTAQLDSGDRVDVTRLTERRDTSTGVVTVSPTGLVRPKADGGVKVTLRQGSLTSDHLDCSLGGMTTADGIEKDLTLQTAAARYDALWVRKTMGEPPLSRAEVLELLALGEVIARKAVYGRQLAVRSARSAGASWSQIGAALGVTKQAAWEAHDRWIDDQAEQNRAADYRGLDEAQTAAARALAGEP